MWRDSRLRRAKWNSNKSLTECPYFANALVDFEVAARDFSNILRYGCLGAGLSASRCCHARKTEVFELINGMTNMSKAVTNTLKQQCDKCPSRCNSSCKIETDVKYCSLSWETR
ncbi:hypothetical protein ElyMa_002638600 [Elysia marginata]|uniref:Uncharacterized protein n=1 Tax=Elysia marginata TaxID=1093978 RepID=A0AAV4H701_9GAST|nr:hypothetical protein ElyMa_002638600 [Elysia marginata]